MKIPLELDIEFLDGDSICFFKDINHSKDSPPHYYFTLPAKEKSCLVVCITTSQIENKIAYYNKANKKCLDSLVVLEKNDCEFVNKKSVIDCNDVKYLHKNALKKRIVPGTYKFVSDKIPESLKRKIIEAIQKSPMVKPIVKESIDLP